MGKSFSVELLNDKTAVPVGHKTGDPLAQPQLLLAAAVVTPEDLTVPADVQSPPHSVPCLQMSFVRPWKSL